VTGLTPEINVIGSAESQQTRAPEAFWSSKMANNRSLTQSCLLSTKGQQLRAVPRKGFGYTGLTEIWRFLRKWNEGYLR
jgi:hypothetical protein